MVLFEGLDCIEDKNTEIYAQYTAISNETLDQNGYSVHCICFAVILLFLFILRKFYYILTDSYSRYPNSKGISIPIVNKLIATSRYLSYKRLPMLFSRVTGLPQSIGTLTIFFMTTLFTLCYAFIPQLWYRGCSGFGPSPLSQRTSIIAMTMTPLLIIMSGKTNFISALSGITYEKLNVFHQALGWGSLFFAVAHTVPFLVQDSREGGFAKIKDHWNEEPLYRNGVAPLVLLFLMCLGGLRFVRKYVYELFWHCHWILGLAYFGTLSWHVFGTIGINYIWASIAFCSVQMLYRIIMKSPFRRNTFTFKHQEATINLLPNHLFEVNVPIKSHKEFFWKPGQHILIRFMSGIHTLDSHPFSILSIPNPEGRSILKLVVRQQKGLTKKIYDNVQNEQDAQKKFKAYIDGAYGGLNRDSLSFDKLILVASGTGISVTLPFMLFVAQNLDDPSNKVTSIDFTWVVRNIDCLEGIKDQLIDLFEKILAKSPDNSDMFNINIFVTGSLEGTTPELIKCRNQLPVLEKWNSFNFDHYSNSSKEGLSTVDEGNFMEFLNVYYGQKPVFKDYIADTSLLEKNAIIVSGSSKLQIDVGNAASLLQKQVLKGKEVNEVYLHTENLGW